MIHLDFGKDHIFVFPMALMTKCYFEEQHTLDQILEKLLSWFRPERDPDWEKVILIHYSFYFAGQPLRA
jgi:hypothetical protein